MRVGRRSAAASATESRATLPLLRTTVVAIVPHSLLPEDRWDRPREGTFLDVWVRAALVVMAVALVMVFAIAWRLDPYTEDGTARSMATHRQLGLPPCTFMEVTGVPCPSCGMTTSFALLIRGDVANSLRANW